MEKRVRLSPQEVFSIKDEAMRKGHGLGPEMVVALCDSHEVYRGFAQRFIDIYAGRVANEQLATEAAKQGVAPQDVQTVALFALFLEIVGPIAPKV